MEPHTRYIISLFAMLLPIAVGCAADAESASSGTESSDAGAAEEGTSLQWTSRGGGPFNRRHARGGAIHADNVSQLSEAWSVEGAPMMGTPVIYDGFAYLTEQTGRVRAVHATTGDEQWVASLDCSGFLSATALATEDTVYIGCWDRGYALNRTDGSLKWMSIIDDSQPWTYTNASPKLAGDRVIFALANSQESNPPVQGGHGVIAGLDAATGTVDWMFDVAQGGVGASVWSSAAIDEARGLLFIGTGQSWQEPELEYADSILAIDFNTGTLNWAHKFHVADIYRSTGAAGGLDFDIGAEPNLWTLGDRDVVSAGSKGGRFKVLDRDTGDEIWQQDIGPGSSLGGIHSTAAIDDVEDVVYVNTNRWVDWQFASGIPMIGHSPSDTADVVKLDGATGEVLWRHTLGGPVLGGGVLLVNDIVLQVVLTGHLVGLDANTGEELWTTDLGHDAASAASFANDMIFVSSGLSYLTGGGRPAGGHVRAFSL